MAEVADAPPPVGAGEQRPEVGRFSVQAMVHVYRRQFGSSLANMLAYRGAITIWVFATLIQPLVYIVVWRTVAGSGSAGGYTADQFVAYFATLLVVDHLCFVWLMWEFEWRVRTGAFSPLLLRPVHPIHKDICDNLTYKVVGLVGILPAAVVLGVAFGADFSGTGPASALAFGPALLLAMVLRFIVEWCLALAAFWLTKVSAINALFFSMFIFFGGYFAPLSVLPEWMRMLALATPFPWSVAFPVEVLLGRRTGSELWLGYLAQLGWILLALLVMRLMWRRATRRYSAVGA